MSPEQEQLWQAIAAYHPDKPDAVLPFSKRLALEQGWTPRFAVRAIEEYKKFIFLVCVAGHPVTPSEQVDEVWHLHLIYTRAYWDEFCGAVLQRPVHHNPTNGGAAEDLKYHRQYQATLDSYTALFGTPPPNDIWPTTDQRFKNGIRRKARQVWRFLGFRFEFFGKKR